MSLDPVTKNNNPSGVAKPHIAYLVSRYPAFSHTFILHEVLRLKALGFNIAVASINDPDRVPTLFTADEAAEAQLTYYIKGDGIRGALWALGSALLRQPLKTLEAFVHGLHLGGYKLGPFYALEALMVGRWMRRKGIAHLHVHFATQAATVGLICKRIFPIG